MLNLLTDYAISQFTYDFKAWLIFTVVVSPNVAAKEKKFSVPGRDRNSQL